MHEQPQLRFEVTEASDTVGAGQSPPAGTPVHRQLPPVLGAPNRGVRAAVMTITTFQLKVPHHAVNRLLAAVLNLNR